MEILRNKDKKLLLILNPVAGKGKGKSMLFTCVELFTKYGFRVSVLPTEAGGKTEKNVAEEAKNYDLLVAIGGDGTLNNVVNGIMQSGCDVPLGYIPLGSTNDFAISLELPKKLEAACEHIATREPRGIDIGKFGDRYFVYIACTGMFASASYMTSQQLKNTIGHSAYLFKGLLSLKDTRKMHFNIVADGEAIEDDYIFASVSNTLSAGGVFKLPKDDILFDDGFFELTMIKSPKTISDLTSFLSSVMHGNLDSKVFVKRKAKYFEIHCENESGWSLDGENGGKTTAAAIEIKEKALRFIY